jgi:hypothetical protein
MSLKLSTKLHAVLQAEIYKDQIANTQNRYYVFAAKTSPFENDSNPPDANNTPYNISYDVHDMMIFGKMISNSDIALLTSKHVWTSNTLYQKYDDQKDSLEDTNFAVLSDEAGSYHVFKCLNNLGNRSTSKPLFSETSEDDETYIKVADDYQWKFMYEISASNYAKFSTDDYMPVYSNDLVANAAVNGAIETITIESGGTDYNSFNTGFFQDLTIGGNNQIFAIEANASSNANFYSGSAIYLKSGTGAGQLGLISQYTVVGSQKRIILTTPFDVTPDATSEYEITPYVTVFGNGSNATARALINATSNTIYKVEMISRGQDYSWANVTISGNTGVVNVSSNTTITANNALARAIISPKGGHGSNNFAEVYASHVGISVTFQNTETGQIGTTFDYRCIGIIKNIELANVQFSIASANGTLLDEMLVTQETTGATGRITFANSSIVRVTNARGSFAAGNRLVSVANSSISANVTAVTNQDSVFDASLTMLIELTNTGSLGNGFSLDETVTQDFATATVLEANSTIVKLIDVRGTLNASGGEDVFITGETTGAVGRVVSISSPDVVKYSGEVLYIENIEPIQRSNTQSETIKLVISM